MPSASNIPKLTRTFKKNNNDNKFKFTKPIVSVKNVGRCKTPIVKGKCQPVVSKQVPKVRYNKQDF